MILVDTNVLLDIFENEAAYFAWSSGAVLDAQTDDRIAIGHVVLAELHGRERPAIDLDQWLSALGVDLDPLDNAIAARAGMAHREYRRRSGPRTSILADFLIGAHAAVRGVPLITRDRLRFASYFPELALITPETHP